MDLNSWGQRASMTWVKGSPYISSSALDYRIQQLNQFQQNSFEPAFQFNNQMSALTLCGSTQTAVFRSPPFMMGYMASASVAKSERLGNQRKYLSMFVQDDWKVTRRLTLNIGMDYSLEFPHHGRYNRKMWFDPTAPLPISQRCRYAAYWGFPLCR